MPGLATTGLIAAALAALWICVAVAVSLVAARRLRLAERVLGAARDNATLLDISPARPLLVRPDGAIEADGRLQRELGLGSLPKKIAELHGNDSGILADDLLHALGAIASVGLRGSLQGIRRR